MIIDKENTLGSAQAITSSAASTDYIDQGAAAEPGQSGKLQMCFTVDEAFTAVGAATLQVALQCDSDSAFGSAKTVIETPAIPKADLVAGYQFFLPLPIGLDEQYVRAYYTVATGPFTAGKMSACVVDGIQKNKAYADALVP
jgi:hypothetical protein